MPLWTDVDKLCGEKISSPFTENFLRIPLSVELKYHGNAIAA
ncbi:MAG: hypothetical protein AAGH81_17490 [Bacteroidota bacterium]